MAFEEAAPTAVPWQRVHPTSALFIFISAIRQLIFPIVVGLFSAQSGGWWSLAALFIGFGVVTGYALVRYLSLRFRLVGDELQVHEGIIFQNNRTVPVQRIQNIDMVQNILHRIFGVAEVRVETASGKEPEAILRVLKLSEIEQLRESVFRRARGKANSAAASHVVAEQGLSPSDAEAAEQTKDAAIDAHVEAAPAPQIVHRITLRQLSLAGLASDRGLLLIPIALGFIFESRSSVRFLARKWKVDGEELISQIPTNTSWMTILFTVLLVLLVLYLLFKLLSIAWYVIRFYGYQLTLLGDDLRVECGLLTRVSATVPRSRIQFISLHRDWLGRKFGIASVRIETAGGGGSENENATQSVARRWFVPVLSESQVASLLGELKPGLRWDESAFEWRPLSPRTLRRLLPIAAIEAVAFGGVVAVFWGIWGTAALRLESTLGLSTWLMGLAAILVALPVTIWRAVKKSRATRYAREGNMVVFRSGVWKKKCSCTFVDKIQTLRISETPFDRRWGMATLAIDTAAAGPAEHRIEVHFMTAEQARGAYNELRNAATAAL